MQENRGGVVHLQNRDPLYALGVGGEALQGQVGPRLVVHDDRPPYRGRRPRCVRGVLLPHLGKSPPGPFLIASILPDDTSSATLSQPVAVLPTGKSISAGATSYVKLKG